MPKSRKFKISYLFTDKLWTMETGCLSGPGGAGALTKLARYTWINLLRTGWAPMLR